MIEILVDFESKKTAIAQWIESLSGVVFNNIRGADQTGKWKYPSAVLAEVSEIDTHRPLKVTEEIDGELKTVIYASRQVMLDISFVTRSRGDYTEDPEDRFLDAEYYMTQFQGKLYNPETSIEFLAKNGLSLLSVGNPLRTDEKRQDGWLRRHVIEIGFGYVAQTSEPAHSIEKIEILSSAIHILGQDAIELEIELAEFQLLEEKEQPNGYPGLDAQGKVPEEQLPDISKVKIFIVANEPAQLALTVQEGDVCVRTDENKTYVALNDVNESLADWQELLSPGAVSSVDGQVGDVNLSTVYAALAHVHSALDVTNSLGFTPENIANKSAVNGYPTLDGAGKVPNTQLPALALTDVHVVANEAAQLALTVQEGDVAVRTDESKSYIALNDLNLSLSDWQELLSPGGGAVVSVDGRVGTVTLTDLYAAIAHVHAGMVVGPGSSQVNEIFVAVDTNGNAKMVPVKIDDSGNISGLGESEQDGVAWRKNGMPTKYTDTGKADGNLKGQHGFFGSSLFRVFAGSAGTVLSLDVTNLKTKVWATTQSTSLGTGSFVALGGGSFAKNLRIGESLFTSSPSGATQVAAGAVAGQEWITSGHATLPDGTKMQGL